MNALGEVVEFILKINRGLKQGSDEKQGQDYLYPLFG